MARMRAPIPGEEHHWWPKSLSKSWCNAEGRIQSLRPNGWRKAYVPRAIGRIPDGHNVLVGGPWNATFEPLYDRPDNDFPTLVTWLSELYRKPAETAPRSYAPVFPDTMRARLAHCLASLIARNPTMRDSVKRTVTYYQDRMGFAEPNVPKHLVAKNIEHLYLDFAKRIETSGKFAFLYAPEGMEFIFGDGFLHNFPNVRMHALNPRCLIPVSPAVSVLWFAPTSGLVLPKTVTIALRPEEVAFCNQTIQVYSKEFIYYRMVEPPLHEGFARGEHLIYEYDGREHADPVLDALMDEVARYRLPSGRSIG